MGNGELQSRPPEELSRQEIAEDCDRQLVDLYREMEQLWYRTARLVDQIQSNELYRELGFASWKDYCQKRLGRPDTSVNNDIKPYRQLKAAGQDPEEFKDLSRARVAEIAVVATTRGAEWDEEEKQELIEVAKQRKPRNKEDKLSLAANEARERLALEAFKPVRLNLTASQREIYDQVMKQLEEVCRSTNSNWEYPDEFKLVDVLMQDFLETKRADKLIDAGGSD